MVYIFFELSVQGPMFIKLYQSSILATTCTDPNKSPACYGRLNHCRRRGRICLMAHIFIMPISPWNKGYVSYNAGLGGETAASGRARFLDEMAVFNPEYVTIMYGANDLKFMRSQNPLSMTFCGWRHRLKPMELHRSFFDLRKKRGCNEHYIPGPEFVYTST